MTNFDKFVKFLSKKIVVCFAGVSLVVAMASVFWVRDNPTYHENDSSLQIVRDGTGYRIGPPVPDSAKRAIASWRENAEAATQTSAGRASSDPYEPFHAGCVADCEGRPIDAMYYCVQKCKRESSEAVREMYFGY